MTNLPLGLGSLMLFPWKGGREGGREGDSKCAVITHAFRLHHTKLLIG